MWIPLVCLLAPLTAPPHAPQDNDLVGPVDPRPFGEANPRLDSAATGEWWTKIPALGDRMRRFVEGVGLLEERACDVAFAVYTHDAGVLKLSAQLFPLRPDDPATVTLEVQRDGEWLEVGRERVVYPGWSAHFRVTGWDGGETVPYRVTHDGSSFDGSIRRDPIEQDVVTVAVMSCNGSHGPAHEPHGQTVANLKALDPDLLFFAGDQHYRHTQHTAGWLDFGLAFVDVLRDRPVVTIPDDHDVGQNNLWGNGGTRATTAAAPEGGYLYPSAYVNMVERQQTWHLPDPVDPAPVGEGYGTYFTRLRVGGVDFAILEDRKFKTGPKGTIPQQGPRPDHVTDPEYDRATVDLPGLTLLGERQLAFLDRWAADWSGARVKAVLSQTAFAGAVHLHGSPDNFLLADLDCNGWPQTGRNAALRRLQAVRAVHLCGDQHLAVVLKHGIDGPADGPYGFTSPALYNSVYGRWWRPADGEAGANPVEGSPLPHTGDYLDGLGNPFRMIAYANPSFAKQRPEQDRADGFGVARFDQRAGTVTFECWSRFADVNEDDMFPGWPVRVAVEDNDTREPVAWLPRFEVDRPDRVVVVKHAGSGEVVHARRVAGTTWELPVFALGTYVVCAGEDVATTEVWRGAAGDRPVPPVELELGDL